MSKHSFVAYKLTVAKARKPDAPFNLGNMNDSGVDFLSLFHGLLSDIQGKPIDDQKYERYLSVEELHPAGRSVGFICESGRYGASGRLVNVKSGIKTKDIDEDESPVVVTRNFLACPESGHWAVLCAERYGGRTAGRMILTTFARAFREKFSSDEYVFKFEGLMDPPAWAAYLQNANMTAIEVSRYGASSDLSDGVVGSTIGRVSCVVKPKRGLKMFSRDTRDGILGKKIQAHDIIGLQYHEGDDTEIVLDDGTQQRRILIDQTEPPVLMYPISDDTQPRPDDIAAFAAMQSKVVDLRRTLGLHLPDGWESGTWSNARLNVALAAIRDV